MASLSYLIKRAIHMDYRSMFEKVNKIHKKTGKARNIKYVSADYVI